MLEEIINKTNFKDVVTIIIVSFAMVCFWRGTWQLLDKYFIPNHFLLSNIIPFLTGLLILVIIGFIKLKTSNIKLEISKK